MVKRVQRTIIDAQKLKLTNALKQKIREAMNKKEAEIKLKIKNEPDQKKKDNMFLLYTQTKKDDETSLLDQEL